MAPMNEVGPGAGAAAAGSVLVLLLTLTSLLLPLVAGVVAVVWVFAVRRKAKPGAPDPAASLDAPC